MGKLKGGFDEKKYTPDGKHRDGDKKKPKDPRHDRTKHPDNVIGGYTKKTAPEGAKLSSGGFIDDGARRMPSLNDPVAKENEQRLRRQLTGRSGRVSTDLSGTRAYSNNFFGDTR